MGDEEDSMFLSDDSLGGAIAFEDLENHDALSEQSLQDLDAQLEEILCLETATNFEQEFQIPELQRQESLETKLATKAGETAPLADTEVMEAAGAKEMEPSEEAEPLEEAEALALQESSEEMGAPAPQESLEETETPAPQESLEEMEAPVPQESLEETEAPALQESSEETEAPAPQESLEETEAPALQESSEETEDLGEIEKMETHDLSDVALDEPDELGEEVEFLGVEYWSAPQAQSSGGPQVIGEHVLGLQQVQPNRLVVPEAPVVETNSHTALPILSVAHHTPILPVELASNLPELEAIQVADAPAPGDQTSDFGQAHTTEVCCGDDHVLDAPLLVPRASFENLVQELVVPQEEKSSGESRLGEKTTHPSAARCRLRRRGSSLETAHTLTREFITDTNAHPHTQLRSLT